MSRSREDMQREAEAEFDALEREAARVTPGVMDLLTVYGGYEEAVARVSRYFGTEHPAPVYSSTDHSGT